MPHVRACLIPAAAVSFLVACGGGSSSAKNEGSPDGEAPAEGGLAADAGQAQADASFTCNYADAGASGPVEYVFVIAMENHDLGSVIGNTSSAPYLNALAACYASTSNYGDPLALPIPSEPHYVWMEAGTNAFSDRTFETDNDPSSTNSTASTEHLSDQLDAAHVSWRSYQQGLDPATTGACPIHSSGFYAAKHDPYVFFQDVAGAPPSAMASACAMHHSALAALSSDLGAGTVAKYNFITPDLCNDMHGASGCPDSDAVHGGDTFLQSTLPAILSFVFAHDGVVFLVWDEGEISTTMPFLAIGPGVKRGYVGSVAYTHSSLLATEERIFGLPKLSTITQDVNDLADLFQPGALP